MAKTLAYGSQSYVLDGEGHRLAQGQKLSDSEYEACPYCKEEVVKAGDIDICNHCDVLIEGATIIYTWEQWDTIPGVTIN